MENSQLFLQINSLPEALKAEAADFVAFLAHKQQTVSKIKERQIGGLKGSFKMAPDFDEPLDDFKDYM